MKNALLYGAVALATLASAGAARAATIVLNNGTPYAYKVHDNNAGSGLSLNLHTKQIESLVVASSTSAINAGSGDGEAQIEGSDKRVGFASVAIDPALDFTKIQFKIEDFGGNTPGHDFDILVNFVGGATQTFSNQLLPSNGKLDIFAGVGELMDRITLSDLRSGSGALQNFKALKQISFEAAAPGVPEPATWAMMLGGFGVLGAAARRRRMVRTLA